jgi:biopolymer transport protein ExbD
MPFLRRGFLKSAHRPNNLYCRIDPLPYLSFILVLLCVFMIDAPPIHSHSVYLFASAHAKPLYAAVKWDAIRIDISRDGSVYFCRRKTLPRFRPNQIRTAAYGGAEKRIYLAVDVRAHYGDVNAVVAEIQSSGVENVSFLMESPRRPAF